MGKDPFFEHIRASHLGRVKQVSHRVHFATVTPHSSIPPAFKLRSKINQQQHTHRHTRTNINSDVVSEQRTQQQRRCLTCSPAAQAQAQELHFLLINDAAAVAVAVAAAFAAEWRGELLAFPLTHLARSLARTLSYSATLNCACLSQKLNSKALSARNATCK